MVDVGIRIIHMERLPEGLAQKVLAVIVIAAVSQSSGL